MCGFDLECRKKKSSHFAVSHFAACCAGPRLVKRGGQHHLSQALTFAAAPPLPRLMLRCHKFGHCPSKCTALLLQAPCLVKRGGLYHLFYSANGFASAEYCIGYAAATEVTGGSQPQLQALHPVPCPHKPWAHQLGIALAASHALYAQAVTEGLSASNEQCCAALLKGMFLQESCRIVHEQPSAIAWQQGAGQSASSSVDIKPLPCRP